MQTSPHKEVWGLLCFNGSFVFIVNLSRRMGGNLSAQTSGVCKGDGCSGAIFAYSHLNLNVRLRTNTT